MNTYHILEREGDAPVVISTPQLSLNDIQGRVTIRAVQARDEEQAQKIAKGRFDIPTLDPDLTTIILEYNIDDVTQEPFISLQESRDRVHIAMDQVQPLIEALKSFS